MTRSLYADDRTSLSGLSDAEWNALRNAANVTKLGARRWLVAPAFGSLVFLTKTAAEYHVHWAIRAEQRYRAANA